MLHFKRLKRFPEARRSGEALRAAYATKVLSCLKHNLALYIDSLEYVSANRNLAFLPRYLQQIEREVESASHSALGSYGDVLIGNGAHVSCSKAANKINVAPVEEPG